MQEQFELVRSALRGIWAHRWWGLATAVGVGIAGAAAVFLIPSKYEASARVFVDTQSILRPLMTGLAVQPDVNQQVQMMSRTLISRPNVERVMRMADLDIQAKTPKEREALVDALLKDIEFRAVGGNNLYNITYRAGSPETAKNVVQSLLSIFVENNLGDSRRDSDSARRFIDEQIKQYEVRLQQAENALKEFKLKHLSVMPNLAQDYVTRASELQAAVNQSRSELRQAENARDAIRKQLAEEAPSFTSETTTEAARPRPPSELDERIEAQRRRLDDLRTRFTDEHPDVIGGRRVLAQLEEQREVERKAEAARNPGQAQQAARRVQSANPVYQQLRVQLSEAEAQAAALRARVADAEARLAEARAMAQTVPKVEAEFAQLNRDYDVNKKSYEALLARRESAQLSGSMEATGSMADFRVVDPPRVGANPVSPNRPLLFVLAFVASIAAGLAAAFARDQIRPTFYDMRSLRAGTGLPLLGTVSFMPDAATRRRQRQGLLAFSGSTAMYVGLFAVLLAWQWLRSLAR